MPPAQPKEDQALQALIEARKFKEALHHVDKKLKKNSNDTTYLISKAEILTFLGQSADSIALLRVVCSSTPPITDLRLLRRIYRDLVHFAGSAAGDRELENLWKAAIKSQGSDKSRIVAVAQDWVAAAISCRRWAHVRIAAKIIQDASSKHKQKYYLWQIVARRMEALVLSTESPKISELNYKLAKQMISEQAGEAPEKLKAEEYKLLQDIYFAMDDPKLLSLSSKSWSLVDAKLSVLENLSDWHGAWKLAKETIEEPDTNDSAWKREDWLLWKALVDAEDRLCRNAHGERANGEGVAAEVTETTRKILKDRIAAQPKSRSPLMAFLTFCSNERRRMGAQSTAESLDQEGLPSMCLSYFKLYSGHQCCFDDLRNNVASFDRNVWLKFRKHIAAHVQSLKPGHEASGSQQLKWIASEINVLKLDYMMTISYMTWASTEDYCERAPRLRNGFIRACLEMYKVSRKHTAQLADTDTRAGDEAALLAVMALTRAARRTEAESFHAYAACLLELLIKHSKYNFFGRGLLVETYNAFGFGSLAMNAYDGLEIRGVLNESLAPILFLNLSLIHPFPVKKGQSQDPVSKIRNSLGFFEYAPSEITTRFQKDALENQKYDKVAELDDLCQVLQWSPTKRLLVLESRRIARLRGAAYTDLPVPGPAAMPDQPTSQALKLINYEAPQASAFFINNPLCREYLDVMLFIDRAYDLATTKGLVELEEFQALIDTTMSEGYTVMRKSCLVAEARYRKMLGFALGLRGASSVGIDSDMTDQLFKNANDIVGMTIDEFSLYVEGGALPGRTPLSSASQLPDFYLALEYLKASHKLATNLLEGQLFKGLPVKQAAKIKADLKVLQSTTDTKFRAIKGLVADLLGALERTTARKLHQETFGGDPDGVGHMILDVVGEEASQKMFASFYESIRDALQGVALVKLS